MVDDNLPHHARGNGKEMPAIIDVKGTVPGDLQVRLVHQRGRAHHLLSTQLAGGETPQVVVQQDEKALRSRLLASAGAPHQFSDFTHGRMLLRLPGNPAGSHSAPTPKRCAIPAQRVHPRE